MSDKSANRFYAKNGSQRNGEKYRFYTTLGYEKPELNSSYSVQLPPTARDKKVTCKILNNLYFEEKFIN